MKTTPSTYFFLPLALLLLSCNDQSSSGRRGKRLIPDFSIKSSKAADEPCLNFLNSAFTSCLDECPADHHLGSGQEIEDLIASIKKDQCLSKEAEANLNNLANNAKGVCVKDINRPNNAVKIQRNFCSCENAKSDIINNCTTFCATTDTNEPTLFVNTKLDPAIALDPQLGSLSNWCSREIGDGRVQPSCRLEVRSENGTQRLEVKLRSGTNSFTADLKSLPKNVTFIAKLVEITSGASSDEFQFRRVDVKTTKTNLGPLKIMPVSQYTCITRAGQSQVGGFNFNLAVRLHFYFAANRAPPSLPPLGTGQVFCHDITTHGLDDSPLFPRLELIPQQFAVWDESDIRFFDQSGSGKEDINDQIEKQLREEFSVTRTINLFGVFRWPNRVQVSTGQTGNNSSGSTADSNGPAPRVGYFMQPFISGTTGRGFCPTQEHYNGNDPLFRVLKEHVGVDTEAIYLSTSEPRVLDDGSGTRTEAPTDILIIRENLLKKIWFYFENGLHVVPDERTANSRTVMFYWPPDTVNPYVRKSTQVIYTIRAPENIGASTTTNVDLRTTVRPADKRFGCVPSLGN